MSYNSPIKVYNSMAFSVYKVAQFLITILEHLHHLKKHPVGPKSQPLKIPSSSYLLPATNVFLD